VAINFLSPVYLLFILLVIPILIWWWRTQTRVRGTKRWAIVGIRATICLLLIMALAGLQLLFPVQEETVVFVVDRSASMSDESKVMTFIRESVQKKKIEDQYAIVTVGKEALVEQPMTARGSVNPLGTVINPHATNLAEGVRLAAGMIPSQSRGKIVLVTDGLETHGDGLTEIKLAKERGISVDTYLLEQELGDEVILTSLDMPNELFIGEEFEVKTEVNSTVATDGVLHLYEGNVEVAQQRITIEKGENHFSFGQKTTRDGFHRYRVELKAARDSIQVNNQGYSYTQVAGTPRILVLEGHEGAAHNLVNALQAGNLDVDVTVPALLPQQVDEYKKYSTIILSDVQATQMKTEAMERIQTVIRDLGLGLIMTGGPDSFGMGGWFKTPIEEALPVAMELTSKEELPSLGLTLVIDKSGSMSAGMGGPNKMELAKEAGIRATEMLNEKDQVGVVAFDGFPWVVVEMQSVTNLEEIQDKIGSIYADGGTEIYTALVEGYEQLKKVNTQRKHVILLTDGQSGSFADYEGLLEEMIEDKITVSTVAVGDDSDTALLEHIAEMGKGRYYFANDPDSIPQIFSKETAFASRTFIVEKPHIPAVTGARDWSTLQQDLPSIHAYVATTPKQTAEIALTSTESDPILARWQYGLGRAVAWTSDIEGKWSPYWTTWEGNSRLWNQIVSWTFPQLNRGGWTTETELEGSTGKITLTLPVGSPMPQQMEAIVLNQKLDRETIVLKPVAPGKLEGVFPATEPGTYLIQVLQKEGEQIIASETAGLNVAYSPEYMLQQGGKQRITAWMEAVEGSLIASTEKVFSGDLPRKWNHQDISEWLLMLAALLWPLDIALRRVQIPAHWTERIRQIVKKRKRAPKMSSAKKPYKEQRVKQHQDNANVREDHLKEISSTGGLEISIKAADSREGTTKNGRTSEEIENKVQKEDPFNRLLAAKNKKRK
jgi:Ca-activated chloride channel family protein